MKIYNSNSPAPFGVGQFSFWAETPFYKVLTLGYSSKLDRTHLTTLFPALLINSAALGNLKASFHCPRLQEFSKLAAMAMPSCRGKGHQHSRALLQTAND